jgi:hypothetical protein
MRTVRSPWRRSTWLALVALLALPVLALFAMNLFLNLGVPYLVNGKPDKLRLQYTFAWSWWPGEVDVWGLAIRGQGKNDQWFLTVDHAEGTIDLPALQDREFRAIGLQAKGGSFRYRFRADGPVDPASDTTPPIPGLTNPPDPPPDPRKSPKGPFKITLLGLHVEDLREVWLEDFRFTSSATATGDLQLGDVMSAKAKLDIPDGQLFRGMTQSLANTLEGEIEVALEGLVRGEPITMQSLTALDARAHVSALTDDLSFLDFYLQSAPWLKLDGTTALAVDANLVDGEFLTGSMMNLATKDLSVGFVAYEIRGDGTARLEVFDAPEEGPSSRLAVKFGAFTVREGAEEPLVEGTGFELTAVSPDTALIAPLTALHVVVDLPESTLPDIQRFGRYLPSNAGLRITGGTGTIKSHVEAWAEDGTIVGTVDLTGDEVRGQMDALVITTDMSLHANLGKGAIGTGVYDFSGTEFEVHDLSIVDVNPDLKRDEEATRSWWARIAVENGVVSLEEPTYFDATIRMSSANSEPFVRIAAQHKSLPGWVQGALGVPDVNGSARIQLGDDRIAVSPFYVSGGPLEVQMRYFRESQYQSGALYARYGKMSVAVNFDPADSEVHVLDAKQWFSGEKDDKADSKARAKAEKADARAEAGVEKQVPVWKKSP